MSDDSTDAACERSYLYRAHELTPVDPALDRTGKGVVEIAQCGQQVIELSKKFVDEVLIKPAYLADKVCPDNQQTKDLCSGVSGVLDQTNGESESVDPKIVAPSQSQQATLGCSFAPLIQVWGLRSNNNLNECLVTPNPHRLAF